MRTNHRNKSTRTTTSPCTQVLKVIGDFWTLCIVIVLAEHKNTPQRFCAIERALPAVNAVTLSARLKKLESLGLITRSQETARRQPVLYALTEKGAALAPIARQIRAYGKKFF